ncbi:hypothetical protein J6TS2_37620 [Heyndrickxia sporothermodurans]|nr:hypothetical protein J6TS2_37620 [Heyndrickxia sporothermodurans]
MKEWYEEPLKSLDSQILWPESRQKILKQSIFRDIYKTQNGRRGRGLLMYYSSIVAVVAILFIGFQFLQKPEDSTVSNHTSNASSVVSEPLEMVRYVNGVSSVLLTPESTIPIDLKGTVSGIIEKGSYWQGDKYTPVYVYYPFKDGNIQIHTTPNEKGEINIIETEIVGREKMWISNRYAELMTDAPQIIIQTKRYVYYISGDNVGKEQVIDVAKQIKFNNNK